MIVLYFPILFYFIILFLLLRRQEIINFVPSALTDILKTESAKCLENLTNKYGQVILILSLYNYQIVLYGVFCITKKAKLLFNTIRGFLVQANSLEKISCYQFKIIKCKGCIFNWIHSWHYILYVKYMVSWEKNNLTHV